MACTIVFVVVCIHMRYGYYQHRIPAGLSLYIYGHRHNYIAVYDCIIWSKYTYEYYEYYAAPTAAFVAGVGIINIGFPQVSLSLYTDSGRTILLSTIIFVVVGLRGVNLLTLDWGIPG